MANLTRAGCCVSAAAALLLLIGCAATADRSTPTDPGSVATTATDSAAARPVEPEPPSIPVPTAVAEPEPAASEAMTEPAPEPEIETGPVPEPEPASTTGTEIPVAAIADPTPAPTAAPAAAPTIDPASKAAPTAPAVTADRAVAQDAATRRLSGRVRLTGDRADVAETVLYFVPDQPAPSPEPGTFELATRDKAFTPTVLAVPRGSMIRFPNRDPILHNVFSVSSGNAFDLGVYGPGSVPDTTLDTVGAVNVYCNVHHDMHAHVLVLDTPWFERAGSDGRFTLNELPSGPGTLHAWHRQADAWSIRTDTPADDSIEVVLEIVRPQLPAHLDKSGQSYQRRDRDPYR